LGLFFFSIPSDAHNEAYSMRRYKSGNSGIVASGILAYNGPNIGTDVAINRNSQQMRHKLFAIKNLGVSGNDRNKAFRSGREVIVVSSGAYANGNDKKALKIRAALYLVRRILLAHLGHVDWLEYMCKLFTLPN
jgi:hypothetical protein